MGKEKYVNQSKRDVGSIIKIEKTYFRKEVIIILRI
jgi:hypothetical protein